MLEKHTTKDGESLLIAEMADDHLTNFIKMILRRIHNRTAVMSGSNLASEYDHNLYGVSVMDEKEAARRNRSDYQLLYPYLAEAFLRDLKQVREALVYTMSRSTGLHSLVLLPPEILEKEESNLPY